MKTHGNLWVWGERRVFGAARNKEKCRLRVHEPGDSAFIFITTINMANWIFQQFLQTYYVLFQWSISRSPNMEIRGNIFTRVLLRLVACAETWIISLNRVGGNIWFSSIFELGIVMIYLWQQPLAGEQWYAESVPCVNASCNPPPSAFTFSKAAAEHLFRK